MTTSVTIKNNGPSRVNVNQVEPDGPLAGGREKTVGTDTLAVGAECTLHVWGQRSLCILETNDVDTDQGALKAAGVGLTAGTREFIIERHVNSRLCYWSPGARGRSSRDDWSEDFFWATRFADHESAARVLIHACSGEGRIVEHAWRDDRNGHPSPASSGGGNG